MAYSELVKNFNKIRAYMREFYVYGFKSREQYDTKSARTYDNEKRRIESYLGEHMTFRQTPTGKTVFLSIDSRRIERNPLYRAWKTKSFTDGDITLHFILLDILKDPCCELPISTIIEIAEEKYLSRFPTAKAFDESTYRNKLKEYEILGLIKSRRQGRQLLFARAPETSLAGWETAVDFFAEAAPLGIVGSTLLDAWDNAGSCFLHKHHYINHTLDSEILFQILEAIHETRSLFLTNREGSRGRSRTVHAVPLRIYRSAQSGREYMMGYDLNRARIGAYRLDYIDRTEPGEIVPEFPRLLFELERRRKHIWGVMTKKDPQALEDISFTIQAGPGELYVRDRMMRECRCGTVEETSPGCYTFRASVYDAGELIPWIRTFLGRITAFSCSNKMVSRQFGEDVNRMFESYGIAEEQGR